MQLQTSLAQSKTPPRTRYYDGIIYLYILRLPSKQCLHNYIGWLELNQRKYSPYEHNMVREKFITCRKKCKIMTDAKERQALGESLKSICRDHSIQPTQLRRWRLKEDQIRASNPNAKTVNRGRISQLKGVQEQILTWISELREKGMPVSMRLVTLKASELVEPDHNFSQLKHHAKYSATRRFMRANNYVVRAKTNVAQRSKAEIVEMTKTFVNSMIPRFVGPHRHQDYIINTDTYLF